MKLELGQRKRKNCMKPKYQINHGHARFLKKGV